VIISALLSAIHVLTLALGLGAVFGRGRALAVPLDEAGWRRLLAADNLWGLAAVLWLASGLGRVFFGGKEPAFYWHNGLFWLKLALFGLVFVLELKPMITFIRVRSARRRRTDLPQFSVEALLRINSAEIVLVVGIVFVAAFMARGAWLF
jgi:putative membrane protein